MLTVKQEKFVQGLFKGLSQREAYKQAYNAENMQPDTIDKRASEIASKGEIKGRLKELQQEYASENKLTVDWVRNQLIEVAERCLQQKQVLENGEPTGEYKFEHNGANRSLELLGKHLGMFIEKQEIKLDANISLESKLKELNGDNF